MDTDRRVEYVDLDSIQLALRNPKSHDTEGIARSISHFGVADLPLLDERTGRLIAGHGRILDLRSKRDSGQQPPSGITVTDDGRWLAPLIRGWASRSDADAEAYLLASNQLTIAGGWNDEALTDVLRSLSDVDADLPIIAGWTQDELDTILGRLDEEPEDGGVPGDPPGTTTKIRSRSGDTWLLGPHQLRCGDTSLLLADILCRRFQEHGGVLPVLESTGEPVDFADDTAA